MANFLLIYGSQTGQSEAVAEQIATLADSQDLEAELLCGEDVTPDYLNNKVAVFVVSSTGDGDPPENFEGFWISLHDSPPENLRFALLGLGDSNYTNFGGFPQAFHDFLEKSGAKSFYDYQLADDQVGLELVVEPWIEGLWDALKSTLTPEPSPLLPAELLDKLSKLQLDTLSDSVTKPVFNLEWDEVDYTQQFPHGVRDFMMPFCVRELEEGCVVAKQHLTTQLDLVKEVVELEISTADPGYGAGDSLGILCRNSESEVAQLLTRLDLADRAHSQYTLSVAPGVKTRLLPKHIMMVCSPWYALTYTLDIHSAPKKALLAYLSECCSRAEEGNCLKYLASKEGSESLNELIYSRSLTLLEILSLFPTCKPQFSTLLQFLPRLTPRYYSVSRITRGCVTPPHATTISFVFNHVTSIREGNELASVPGVCTSWMRNLEIGDPVFMYRRKNDSFKPDFSDTRPLIMIGAGTGVSPFLGFLAECQESGNFNNTTVLVTGNRYKALDSIYSEHFNSYSKCGVLTHYKTVYSREGEGSCKYVQDILSRDSVEIGAWLEEGARVYVCGDAKGLGVAVFNTIKSILSSVKNVSETEALGILSEMKRNKQYCEDIWS